MAGKHRKTGAQRGLTLIEVVVAFVVASLSVVAVMRIFSTGLAGSQVTADYMTAAMIAEARLAEVGVVVPLRPGTAEGQAGERFAWALEVERLPQDEDTPVMEAFAVTATVLWRDGDDVRRFSLSSMRSHAAP